MCACLRRTNSAYEFSARIQRTNSGFDIVHASARSFSTVGKAAKAEQSNRMRESTRVPILAVDDNEINNRVMEELLMDDCAVNSVQSGGPGDAIS